MKTKSALNVNKHRLKDKQLRAIISVRRHLLLVRLSFNAFFFFQAKRITLQTKHFFSVTII
jgi:hypothetical protein